MPSHTNVLEGAGLLTTWIVLSVYNFHRIKGTRNIVIFLSRASAIDFSFPTHFTRFFNFARRIVMRLAI